MCKVRRDLPEYFQTFVGVALICVQIYFYRWERKNELVRGFKKLCVIVAKLSQIHPLFHSSPSPAPALLHDVCMVMKRLTGQGVGRYEIKDFRSAVYA